MGSGIPSEPRVKCVARGRAAGISPDGAEGTRISARGVAASLAFRRFVATASCRAAIGDYCTRHAMVGAPHAHVAGHVRPPVHYAKRVRWPRERCAQRRRSRKRGTHFEHAQRAQLDLLALGSLRRALPGRSGRALIALTPTARKPTRGKPSLRCPSTRFACGRTFGPWGIRPALGAQGSALQANSFFRLCFCRGSGLSRSGGPPPHPQTSLPTNAGAATLISHVQTALCATNFGRTPGLRVGRKRPTLDRLL